MFQVVIPMWNAAAWITRNIHGLQRQACGDFRCLLLDDCSTDDSVGAARRAIGADKRFQIVVNQAKLFALGNLVQAIATLQVADEDVVVLVDADDWLAHERVLEKLQSIYESTDCWVTYGSYASQPDGRVGQECEPYPASVIRANGIRWCRWRGAHLRTFKGHLWQRIDPAAFGTTDQEIRQLRLQALLTGRLKTWRRLRGIAAADLLDPSGRYFRRCYDKAVMIPLLELAGSRSHYVAEVLYHYNGSHNAAAYAASALDARRYTRSIRAIIRARPRYLPVPEVASAFVTTPSEASRAY